MEWSWQVLAQLMLDFRACMATIAPTKGAEDCEFSRPQYESDLQSAHIMWFIQSIITN